MITLSEFAILQWEQHDNVSNFSTLDTITQHLILTGQYF